MIQSGNEAVADTLDDWKNLLFAYDAFAHGIRSVKLPLIGLDAIEVFVPGIKQTYGNPRDAIDAGLIFARLPGARWFDLASDIFSNLVHASDYELGPKLSTLFKGTALEQPFAAIATYGIAETTNMLMSAFLGNPTRSANKANYADALIAFFGALTPS